MTSHIGPVRNVTIWNPKIFLTKIFTFVMFRYLHMREEEILYIRFPLMLPNARRRNSVYSVSLDVAQCEVGIMDGLCLGVHRIWICRISGRPDFLHSILPDTRYLVWLDTGYLAGIDPWNHKKIIFTRWEKWISQISGRISGIRPGRISGKQKSGIQPDTGYGKRPDIRCTPIYVK